MSADDKKEWVIISWGIAFLVASICIGYHCGYEAMKEEAIAHQSAHYIVNPVTGETSFEWFHP